MVAFAVVFGLFFRERSFSRWGSLRQISLMEIVVIYIVGIHLVVKCFTLSSDHFVTVCRVSRSFLATELIEAYMTINFRGVISDFINH